MSVNEVTLRDEIQSRAQKYGFSIEQSRKNHFDVLDSAGILIYRHRMAQDSHLYSNDEIDHILAKIDNAAKQRKITS